MPSERRSAAGSLIGSALSRGSDSFGDSARATSASTASVDVAEPDAGGAYAPFGFGADVVLLPDRAGRLHGSEDLVRGLMHPSGGDALAWLAPPGRVQSALDVVAQSDVTA